ncbi:UDP-2,3-diacylglucosamine diphosphatase [Pelagibaculum spongiae]|uniref:UDP-2,3-diacylglucosamine hydrolase n=1 Tax=Pelagibaculum spongiae TaxID=2080658 RepID=A0A2V1H372_9GAMM|nr:UDP-2,3-diacylglucosamine diphosphatase [Pelagibaculum spongiae]PVZ71668.1 UDP-2,3-diacylglucosamine diphosphatase [Pelagibaculum spongiae]
MIRFISDLHLDASQPKAAESFFQLLQQLPGNTRQLYILGDFFEAWIGDDSPDPFHQQVMQQLKLATDTGLKIFFMHGNRDFLIGEDFAKTTGCELISDPMTIELDGKKVLLMHGDSLCTDDLEYQKIRPMLRNPQWQADFLSKSIPERIAFAQQARAESSEHTSQTNMSIMDTNQQAIEQIMKQHNVATLIHGHTHRPAVHSLQIDGQPAQRIVLGDWYHQCSVLEFENGKFDLRSSAFSS